MPYTPGTVFADGTTMDAAAVRAELVAIRAWQNEILATDMVAGQLNRTHIYRPDVAGFPKQNLEAPTQEKYEDFFGIAEEQVDNGMIPVAGSTRQVRAVWRERRSIFLAALLTSDRWVIPHMARRVVLDETAEVEIIATWNAWCAYNPDPVSANLSFLSTAGRFRLIYTPLGAAPVILPGTRRKINPHSNSSIAFFSVYSTGTQIQLGAGTYDFALEYIRDGADSRVTQVIIASPTIVLNVQKL